MIHLTKTQTAPPCLALEKAKPSGNYNTDAVLQQIQSDFKNKCYICEDKAPTSINIEHFIPHRGNLDLKFDWDNLFYACYHCNNTKVAKYDNILNCLIDKEDIEHNLNHVYEPFPKILPSVIALKEDQRVKNTAEFLTVIYRGSTFQKKMESKNLSDKLFEEMKKFQDCLAEYYYLDEDETELRARAKEKIRLHLKSSSAFTAFKRWLVRRNSDIYGEFLPFFEIETEEQIVSPA